MVPTEVVFVENGEEVDFCVLDDVVCSVADGVGVLRLSVIEIPNIEIIGGYLRRF